MSRMSRRPPIKAIGPKRAALRVGTRVRFVFGLGEVMGTVIEDRGDLGVNGSRLLRVRFEIDGVSDPLETEIPAAQVKVAA